MEECPLCGRKTEHGIWESYIPTDPTEITNQIDNLERVLDGLRNRDASIIYYTENKERLCPMCQDIINGIEDESDRRKFEVRINKQVEKLEEKIVESENEESYPDESHRYNE